MKQEKVVLIFDSIHFVLKAEAILNQEGFTTKVTPVPRTISSDCGVCLTCLESDSDWLFKALRGKKCLPKGIFAPDSRGRYTEILFTEEREIDSGRKDDGC